MKLPGFTAEAALGKSTRTYHGKYVYGGLGPRQSGLPAIVLPSQLDLIEGLDDTGEGDLLEQVGPEEAESDEEMENGDEADLLEQTDEGATAVEAAQGVGAMMCTHCN